MPTAEIKLISKVLGPHSMIGKQLLMPVPMKHYGLFTVLLILLTPSLSHGTHIDLEHLPPATISMSMWFRAFQVYSNQFTHLFESPVKQKF
jgi:hypothetical protein